MTNAQTLQNALNAYTAAATKAAANADKAQNKALHLLERLKKGVK